MMGRIVRLSKYCSIVQTSSEITKKTSISTKDKSIDNIDMLDKALRASNLLSLMDGSRKQPDVTTLNNSEYTAEAIITSTKADGTKSLAEDDYYKFHADSIVVFTFMLSMINKDMHHMLGEAIKEEDSMRVYRVIQEHFKGGGGGLVPGYPSQKANIIAMRFSENLESELLSILDILMPVSFDNIMSASMNQVSQASAFHNHHVDTARRKLKAHRPDIEW